MKLAKCCCSLGLVIGEAFAAIKTGGRNLQTEIIPNYLQGQNDANK